MYHLGHHSLSAHGSPGRVLGCVRSVGYTLCSIHGEILSGWRFRVKALCNGICCFGGNGCGTIDSVYPLTKVRVLWLVGVAIYTIKRNEGDNE